MEGKEPRTKFTYSYQCHCTNPLPLAGLLLWLALAVTSSTLRTFPSWSACALVILASGQSFLGASLQRRRTRSPSRRLWDAFCHFLRGCNVGRYSFLHRDQKTFARCWTRFHCLLRRFLAMKSPGGGLNFCGFCVSSVAGVRISGASGSLDTGTSGLALTMTDTLAIKVVKTSWATYFDGTSARIASNTRLVFPIILSHAPPACQAWGGLKSHAQPSFKR